ncbi:hypothetical protein K435DRAFT_344394 [Dendrothele bispora CBS 962.96]|uniref:Uncharacterized protein n=1 Tax=Dendrothele bispora (strain CBS 962.96) TaxID=1314807 RepID=A0A4V6T5L6_DENBC|nr:hypothetical protein K435DRAFT_344394 [Dendrothele bispora CBS 962.96]
MSLNQDAEHLQITTGTKLDGDEKLAKLALNYPFLRQLDVIFPANQALEDVLESLPKPRYFRQKVSLEQMVQGVMDLGDNDSSKRISVLVSSESSGSSTNSLSQDDDVWCIDPRGVLTLSVCKNTYETLGLVGKRVAFGKGKSKQGDGRHVIPIPLLHTTKNAESQKIRARRDVSIKRWDMQRAQMNNGSLSSVMDSPTWNVLFSSGTNESAQILSDKIKESSSSSTSDSESKPKVEDTVLRKKFLADVHIPVVQLSSYPSRQSQSKNSEEYEDLLEDWEHDMEALFEWIGLAGFGSQRLKANDCTDSYVSSYEVPSRSVIGTVTHLQWTGFLESSFVQSVIDTLTRNISSSSNTSQFASITGHTCSWSPISYIPPNLQEVPPDNMRSPMRDPTMEVEDTWCLVMTCREQDATSNLSKCQWALARNSGRHDSWE